MTSFLAHFAFLGLSLTILLFIVSADANGFANVALAQQQQPEQTHQQQTSLVSSSPSPFSSSSSSEDGVVMTYALPSIADYFHFQDVLFGPTVKETEAFCVRSVQLWEASNMLAAEASATAAAIANTEGPAGADTTTTALSNGSSSNSRNSQQQFAQNQQQQLPDALAAQNKSEAASSSSSSGGGGEFIINNTTTTSALEGGGVTTTALGPNSSTPPPTISNNIEEGAGVTNDSSTLVATEDAATSSSPAIETSSLLTNASLSSPIPSTSSPLTSIPTDASTTPSPTTTPQPPPSLPPTTTESPAAAASRERREMLRSCVNGVNKALFQAMGEAQPSPSASSPQRGGAPHGTLVFRLLPGPFWGGVGYGDFSGGGGGGEAEEDATTVNTKDPILKVTTLAANAWFGLKSLSSLPTSEAASATLSQWARFIANASVPTGGNGSSLSVSSSSSPSWMSHSRTAVTNPARHQLGASLAVLCHPHGYTKGQQNVSSSGSGGGSGSGSGVFVISNISASCGLGDFRSPSMEAALRTSNVFGNLTTEANPEGGGGVDGLRPPRTMFPFAGNTTAKASAAVNTTAAAVLVRRLLTNYVAERLRGRVFAVSWDKGVSVEAFAETGDSRPIPKGVTTIRSNEGGEGTSGGNSNGNEKTFEEVSALLSSVTAADSSFYRFGPLSDDQPFVDSVQCPHPISRGTATAWYPPLPIIPTGVVAGGAKYRDDSAGDGRSEERKIAEAFSKLSAVATNPQTLSNTFQRDFGSVSSSTSANSVASDCRRVAIRIPIVSAIDANNASSPSSSFDPEFVTAITTDVVIADTVIACEPMASPTYRSYAAMRAVSSSSSSGSGGGSASGGDDIPCLSLLRPHKPLRASERIAAGSSFSFGTRETSPRAVDDPAAAGGSSLTQQAVLPPSPPADNGWELTTDNTDGTPSPPQSIFAHSYTLGKPFAYAEMSPVPRSSTRRLPQTNASSSTSSSLSSFSSSERSPLQRGTRLVVEERFFNVSSQKVVSTTAPVVGIIGLSPAPSCQTTSAVVAYYPLQNILLVSRNLSTLSIFLAENLRIFGVGNRFGFRLDLQSNFGAPMTAVNAPLSPTSLADGLNSPNIAWFDVHDGTSMAVNGPMNMDWTAGGGDANDGGGSGAADGGSGDASSSSSPQTASTPDIATLSASAFPFPTFSAVAIGTCPSGRRVISEQVKVPQGEPLTNAVTVIVAAPHFGSLILSRSLMLGLRAWTNLTCYRPSADNKADVDSVGGLAALRHAQNINRWSSHPLTGLSVTRLDFVLCRTRRLPAALSKGDRIGVTGYDDGDTSDGKSNDQNGGGADGNNPQPGSSLSRSGGNTSLFPSITVHPDLAAGGGTYPSHPSAYFGTTSTAFYTSTEARSLKIRLTPMARPHATHGSVVPLYVAQTADGGRSGGLASAPFSDPLSGSFVVLGSGALTDYLVLSDSNSGRIGFVPAIGKEAAERARLTPQFSAFASPIANLAAANGKSGSSSSSGSGSSSSSSSSTSSADFNYGPSPRVGSLVADAPSQSILDHSWDPFDWDALEADCAAPVPCDLSYRQHIRSLNLCVDPSCGSWISHFNFEEYTCDVNVPVVVGIVLAISVAVILEMALSGLFIRQIGLLNRQQGKQLEKKEV